MDLQIVVSLVIEKKEKERFNLDILNKDRDYEKDFIHSLLNLEGLEFIGVATLFGVPITTNGKDTLPLKTILQGILDKFREMDKKKQKDMLVLVRQASKGQKLYPGGFKKKSKTEPKEGES